MSNADKQVGCAECSATMILRKNKYGKLFLQCSRFPACSCSHGAHADGTPLGFPADKETRTLRRQCHAVLDPLWKNGECTRAEAYIILQKILRLPEKDAHIGKLNKQQCLFFLREFAMLGDVVTLLLPKEE